MKTIETDYVVIGAGHNGLVAACYLAKAGYNVVVVEASHRFGGMAHTAAEIPEAPDHLITFGALDNVYFRSSPVPEELNIQQYGYREVEHDPWMAWLSPDGERSLILQKDIGKTIADIRRFSDKDAQAYEEYLSAAIPALEMLNTLNMTHPADLSLKEKFKLIWGMTSNRKVRQLLLLLATNTPNDAICSLFESEAMRSFLTSSAQILGPLQRPGAGVALLALAVAHTLGVGRPIGGMQAIPDSLSKVLAAHNGKVELNAPVRKIQVQNNRACGVVLEDGRNFKARRGVLACCAPQLALGELLDEGVLPEDITNRVRNIPANSWGTGAFKLDMALRDQVALPGYQSWRDRVDGEDLRKPFLIYGIYEQHLAQEALAQTGEYLDDIPHWISVMTARDPSQAPEGQDVLSIYALAPLKVTGGWTAEKANFASKLENTIKKYLTGINEYEIGRVVSSPDDITKRFRSPNGALYHVDYYIERMGPLRPARGLGHYETPVQGLYIGTSGSHPGGGVSGLPGRLSALKMLRDTA